MICGTGISEFSELSPAPYSYCTTSVVIKLFSPSYIVCHVDIIWQRAKDQLTTQSEPKEYSGTISHELYSQTTQVQRTNLANWLTDYYLSKRRDSLSKKMLCEYVWVWLCVILLALSAGKVYLLDCMFPWPTTKNFLSPSNRSVRNVCELKGPCRDQETER